MRRPIILITLVARTRGWLCLPEPCAAEAPAAAAREGSVALVVTGEFERQAVAFNVEVNMRRAAAWARARAWRPEVIFTSDVAPRADAWLGGLAAKLSREALPATVLRIDPPPPCPGVNNVERNVQHMIRKVRAGLDAARAGGFEFVFRLRAETYVERMELPPRPWAEGRALFRVPSAAGPSDNFFVGYAEAAHLAWPRLYPYANGTAFDPRRWPEWPRDPWPAKFNATNRRGPKMAFDPRWACAGKGFRPIGPEVEARRRLTAPERCFEANCAACGRCEPTSLDEYALHNVKKGCGGRSWIKTKNATRMRGMRATHNFFGWRECAARTGSPSCSHVVGGGRYWC